MTSQISERIFTDLHLETLSLMVHLPLYLKLDDDFAGSARILKILSELYGFGTILPEVEMGEKQYEQVNPAMIDNPQLKDMVERFERESDTEDADELDVRGGQAPGSSGVSLSPEIEQFLSEIAEGELGSDSDESDSPRE
jgi:hypothetical protein